MCKTHTISYKIEIRLNRPGCFPKKFLMLLPVNALPGNLPVNQQIPRIKKIKNPLDFLFITKYNFFPLLSSKK